MKDDGKREKLNRIADDMSNQGLLFSELFQMLAETNSPSLGLSDKVFANFASLYDRIDSGNYSQVEKGKLLEDLIAILFEEGYPTMLDIRKNMLTSSNEIDILVNWSKSATQSGIQLLEDEMGSYFLVECKNYNNKVGVTYLGKFFSLMCYTDTKLGVFIAWNGMTGSDNSWNDAVGLVKKLALGEKKYILVLTKADLKKIRQKETNIFTLLEHKYLALKTDISYKSLIKKHEIEIDNLSSPE